MIKRTLILLSLLVSPQALFADTINSAAASPSTLPAGTSTSVTFTASIPSSSVVASSVILQQTASRGLATPVGTMYDDGTHGDTVANDGVYTVQVPIYQQTPGTLTYSISAQFQGSLTRSFSAPITVTVTGTGTAISIGSPAESAYLSISPTVVSGTITDPHATVSVNGLTAQVSGLTYSASIPLREGSNKITAVASNSNGTSATATANITLDTTPPHVTISAPVVNAVTDSATVNVSGIVNDIVVGTVNSLQATVDVNGLPAKVSNRTYLAQSIPLQIGANTLTATARDRAGNFTSASLIVTRIAPSTQATLRVISGDGLSGPIKTVVGSPLVVQALNAAGQPIANTPVVFQVVKGDGSVSLGTQPGLSATAVNTNAQGMAQVNFILGSHAGAGNNQVQASATGIRVTPVFTESASTTVPALIVVDTGGNQSGVVGQTLPLPFIAVVTDAGHNRLTNIPVTFTVMQGGGTIGRQTTVTTNSDGDGRVQAILSLGPQAGINNNVVTADFAGDTGLPATFDATSYVPGPTANTAISGTVLDNSNNPIPGVTMRLYQVNNGGTGVPQEVVTAVQTNAAGYFMILPAPVGVYKLMADGTTATSGGPFPTLEYDLVTVSGQNITVGQPIYLQHLNPQNEICVSPTVGGTLTLTQAPGFALTVAPNTAVFPGGSRTGCISVTPVNMDKVPMVPGFGQQPRFIVTIQPVGTIFTTPAQLTIPNVDGLAPRSVTEMYSYDHDLASFVAIGTATVSADGSTITSDPGVGVLKAGWHCGGDPNTSGTVADCPTCKKCIGSACALDPNQDQKACSSASVPSGICTSGMCAPVTPKVKIVQPSPNMDTAFFITGDATPAMPTINAMAVVRGVSPDPTDTTMFNWTVTTHLGVNQCPNGPKESLDHTFSASVKGGSYTPVFPQFQGGDLTLTVQALVNGQNSQDQTAKGQLNIWGTNPVKSIVQSALPHDTLRRIACLESGQRQFAGVGCPLFSMDNQDGVGIMQITPWANEDQIWNWTVNVQDGITVFNGKKSIASGYPSRIRASDGWIDLVSEYNQARQMQGLDAIQVTLPDFTTGDFNSNLQQFEKDTIRAYNGVFGDDGFTSRLHEFRVALTPSGPLQEDSSLIVADDGSAHWETVPVSARPSAGDPNYVANVLAKSPQCP